MEDISSLEVKSLLEEIDISDNTIYTIIAVVIETIPNLVIKFSEEIAMIRYSYLPENVQIGSIGRFYLRSSDSGDGKLSLISFTPITIKQFNTYNKILNLEGQYA